MKRIDELVEILDHEIKYREKAVEKYHSQIMSYSRDIDTLNQCRDSLVNRKHPIEGIPSATTFRPGKGVTQEEKDALNSATIQIMEEDDILNPYLDEAFAPEKKS